MASYTPPFPPSPYFGYRNELADAGEWLSEGRNFAVQGAPGSGKTAFLSKIISDWQQSHANQIVLWLDLDRGITTSAQIGEDIVKALGHTSVLNKVPDDAKPEVLSELRNLLSPAGPIIVLDNVNSTEQAKAVWELSRVVPRLLVGARNKLNLPQLRIIGLSQLEVSDALQLLRHHAGTRLRDEQALCKALGYQPGPIESIGLSRRLEQHSSDARSRSTFTVRRTKHFRVEFTLIDTAGQPSALYYDLNVDREKRIRRIERLTDDFLYTKIELHWPTGPDGRWILVPLRGDVALCQWNPGNPALWELDLEVGRLNVVRIVRKTDIKAILKAYAATEPDE
jgi:GTPase SAR1 family protein